MYFRQILNEDLGCASYLLADSGEAAVVDPKWEIDEYLRAADEAGAEIRHVLETHHHADHLSGRRRLLDASGATPHVPADPTLSAAPGLRDGDVIRIGRLQLRAVAAPGHRPEHLAFVVSDESRAPGEPCMLLSGDSLLVGDVARPDLAVDPQEGALALWDTLRRFERLGDHVELWRRRIGGSLCGSGSLSPRTSSTLGHERRANRLLSVQEPAAFAAAVTRCPPARPPRATQVVELNRTGAARPDRPDELDVAGLTEALSRGACPLDVRAPMIFDAGHLPGSLNLSVGGAGVATRAGWAASPDEPLVIVSDTVAAGMRAAELLYAGGVCNIVGVAVADPPQWTAAGLRVSTAPALTAARLGPLLSAGEHELLDVRELREWRSGHIAGSLHLPMSELADPQRMPAHADGPLAVVCASGGRAALATSVLRRRGHERVSRVTAGIGELARNGLPLVSDAASP